jgi:hypothetical protein
MGRGEVTERPVLAGRGFFLDGRLVVAVIDDQLCVPVGHETRGNSSLGPGIRPLLFAGRPVPGWVMVEAAAISAEETLARWIDSVLSER